MQGFLFFNMVLYRQITVLFLFFSILILFFVPSQETYLFIILKGLVIGGLCVVFTSYAFPKIYSKNGLFKLNKVKNDYEEKTFSSAIKIHYDRLIKHAEEIIFAVNNDYSVGIYMYDSANKGFSLQNNSIDSFKSLINEENKAVIEILSTNKSQIFRIKDKLNQWEELLSHKTWKGSETIIALPVRYKDHEIGFILVFTEHFSSINNKDQYVIEKVVDTITSGMSDLEEIESLMINKNFNSKVSKLLQKLDLKSDSTEFIDSIRGICRTFFKYDKLTIVFLNEEEDSAKVVSVDGFNEDVNQNEDFDIKNSLHGLSILENKTISSNDWFDKFPEMNRFFPNDRENFNFKSVLSVPLRSNGKAFGAVTLERQKPKLFSEVDIQFIESLCGTLSSGLKWKNEYNKVHISAMNDGLTGLLNHKAFLKRFKEELSRANRFNQDLGLIVLDLDKFKFINDTYGHLYGDFVLRHVSNIISENVRTIDVVGRYGGEEFSVLLVNTNIEDCEPMAQRIVDKIAQNTFLKDGIASNITISAGMAGFPSHSDQIKGLIDKADKAMYVTKSNGGNGVTISNSFL
jgi:diguanylate cyclase (GGDEF)-like protein